MFVYMCTHIPSVLELYVQPNTVQQTFSPSNPPSPFPPLFVRSPPLANDDEISRETKGKRGGKGGEERKSNMYNVFVTRRRWREKKPLGLRSGEGQKIPALGQRTNERTTQLWRLLQTLTCTKNKTIELEIRKKCLAM